MHTFEQVKNTGNSFKAAFERCNMKIKKSEEEFEWLAVPAIVNACFACELYLKALNLREKKKTERVHGLKKLFDSLNEETRTSIKSTVNEVNFDGELSAISNGFVEWRYIYEQSQAQANLGFIETFVNALSGEIEKNKL